MMQRIQDILRDAGRLALGYFGNLRRDQVDFKKETDLVTEADRAVERFLRDRLLAAFPDCGFLGEEGTGGGPGDRSGRFFVVDPIDGTTSFVHGLPNFSISLALKENGKNVLGAVHAPVTGEMYHAEAGGGAWKGDCRLHVSGTAALIHSLGATGFACVRARMKPDGLPIFNRAVYALRGVRRLGSAALDLCLVAEGKLDLYWEMQIQPWDIAAGMLLVREAGGRVTDYDGGDGCEERRQIVATNGLIHDAFLQLIRDARAAG